MSQTQTQTQGVDQDDASPWEGKDESVESSPNPRKPPKLGQTSQQLQQRPPPEAALDEAYLAPERPRGRRIVPVHQSRITDRPPKVGEKDSSLKIKIELDLEVEVEIYARVKGDVMIGLM